MNLGKIPNELKTRRQWVVYRPDKVPVNPRTGGQAKAGNPETWADFQAATQYLAAHKNNGVAGLGFEFAETCPYAGVDLDKCRDPETGQIEAWARAIIDRLRSYTEISPSGRGVHILIKGKLPPGGNRKGKVEMYSQGRYFTMTGHHLAGTPTTIEPRQAELEVLHKEIFGQPRPAPPPQAPSHPPDLHDSEIIARAKAAQNRDKFNRLMGGDLIGYPTQSEADMALCSILAFWTRDSGQIDRIFRQSGLMRDKWGRQQSGSTYGLKTIEKALASTTETYQGRRPERTRNPETGMPGKPALKVVGSQGAPAATPALKPHFNLTDLGNGQRLVARHGRDLRYCYPWGRWLLWDGQRWGKDSTGEVDRRAKETVRRIYAEAAEIEDKDLRNALVNHARHSESDSKRQAMINSAKSEPEIPIMPDDLDRDPWLLNVLNGTLDLRTGELRPHERGDLISKLAPVEFDGEAECPAWGKFLERIFNHNFDLILFLKKAVGYALTGNTREQCLFFLYGLGANGKSTFLDVIQTMLGDYATQTTSETFMVKKQGGQLSNDVADLRGARFVSAVEIESGRRMAEVLIKQMTGGDRLKARFLYSEFFEFKPEFKIFLAANHKPVIRGTDNAIWRRIYLIPFTVQIPREEQDRELPDKLKAEFPGILNWAKEGCINWKNHDLDPPQSVQEATQTYREEMDILGNFLSECCLVVPGASASAKDLYEAYYKWAEDNGEKRPLSQRNFGVNLTERGFQRGRSTGGQHFWWGIGLKEE
jgi:putative DNA primase/helicase